VGATSAREGSLRGEWPLLFSGFVINFVLMGGMVDTISVFIHAIAETEGWSRSSLSGGVTVAAASAAFVTPIVGVAVDRWGVRVPMTFGLFGFAAGFALLIAMTEPWQWVAAQLFFGTGFAFTAVFPITIAVTVCVKQRTALALGIVAVGSSAGTLVCAPLLQATVDSIGWRDTYIFIAAVVILVPIPLLLFALPRGPLRREPQAPSDAGGSLRAAIGRELRRPAVRALVALMFIPAFVSFGIHVHLVDLLTDRGNTARVAAAALGIAIGISAFGKLAGGFAGGRFGELTAFRMALVLELLAVVALWLAASLLPLGIFTLAHGLAMGTRIAVIPVIAIAVLGTERFATRFGLIQLITTLGAALAPLVPGVIYDRTGSYDGALGVWLVAIVAGIAIAFRMRIRVNVAAADPTERG
jgi:predicted MFS family arabinose efflux permease